MGSSLQVSQIRQSYLIHYEYKNIGWSSFKFWISVHFWIINSIEESDETDTNNEFLLVTVNYFPLIFI